MKKEKGMVEAVKKAVAAFVVLVSTFFIGSQGVGAEEQDVDVKGVPVELSLEVAADFDQAEDGLVTYQAPMIYLTGDQRLPLD